VYFGWARAELGEAELGATQISDGLAAMEGTGAWMLHTFFLALLAEAQWRAGRPDQALVSVEEALKLVETTGERFYEAELHRLRGELVLVLSPQEVAHSEREMLEALALARDQGAGMLELRVADSLRRLGARTDSS
jgi:predicted ATPase